MDIENYQSTNAGDLSHYEVQNRREIERIIRGLLHERIPVSMKGAGSHASYLTIFTGIDEDAGWVYLDRKLESQIEEDLLSGKGAELEAKYEGVRILFRVSGAACVEQDGRAVYRIGMPANLYRFQRRKFYRISLPVLSPARCIMRLSGRDIEAKIIDISVGGVSIRYAADENPLEPGLSIEEARLFLSESDDYKVMLKVRSNQTITLRNDVQIQRAGCEFHNLPASLERAIQTFIFKMERKRPSGES